MSDPNQLSLIGRLQRCHTMGVHYREQMEAQAEECCRIFGVDPNSGSDERDWCTEIVTHGTSPHEVYAKIMRHRRLLSTEECE